MPIPKELLKLGKNEIIVKTLYKWSTHLESVYLIGDFGVKAELKNSKITAKMPEMLACKSFSEQIIPFYSGNVTYKLPYEMYCDKVVLKDGERLFLSAKFFGAAVRVTDGESLDEIIAWEPYEVDITDAVKTKRDLNITVLGTRKNTFGPLHSVPCVVHRCGHGSFTTEGEQWCDEYNLIDDGLREIRLTVKKNNGV